MGKLIVISAPSGAGKTTIVHYLLDKIPELAFSISACSREKRKTEKNGKDYYFLGVKEFQRKIQENAFLEWEEVYSNQYYGTLKSEIERIWKLQKHVVFDVDVIGGINIKKQYAEDCLSIFIMPPSIGVLKKRLRLRQSESEAIIETRIRKAAQEILRNKEFDCVVLNKDLTKACKEAALIVKKFINKK